MPFANRAGTFKAAITGAGILEEGEHKLATAVIRYALLEEQTAEGMVDVRGEQLEITGWHYLEKKDGAVNQMTIDGLKAALGWDGRDPFWIQDTDLSAVVVQLVLAFESYQGKDRLKVKYLNPENYEGRGGGDIPKADAGTRRSIATRLGSKLRALAGGTPANPPKPGGAPKPPAPRSAPPAAAKSAPAVGCTRDEAWAALLAAKPTEAEGWWPSLLTETIPGKDEESFTAEDWGKVREAAKATAKVPY